MIKTTLGEEFEIIMGQSPPSGKYNSEGKGLPFFQGKKEFTDLYPEPAVWCTEPTKIAFPGDVLLSVRAPIGTVNIAKTKCGIGRGLAAIRPNNKSSTKFIFYLLELKEQEIQQRGTGTTFSAITKPRLYSIPIEIPETKKERDASTATIETQFTRIDKITKAFRAGLEKTNVLRKSILKKAFGGGFK